MIFPFFLCGVFMFFSGILANYFGKKDVNFGGLIFLLIYLGSLLAFCGTFKHAINDISLDSMPDRYLFSAICFLATIFTSIIAKATRNNLLIAPSVLFLVTSGFSVAVIFH